ncbi:MAG: S24 family peptidase [Planctomycetota bacterium]
MAPESGQSPTLFGARLRELRESVGLSLEALGARVARSRSYLSGLERGTRRPPDADLIEELERALGAVSGALQDAARWERTPEPIRAEIELLRREKAQSERFVSELRSGSLDQLLASGKLQAMVASLGDAAEGSIAPVRLPMQVPLINSVKAGYPTEFTDLGYPARHADDYVRVPDLDDPDAFAARVVGDSMEPDYREGDVVVFSPARSIASGDDCFARLEPDQESTFKRVYFETDNAGDELIRLQPVNNSYPPRVLPREHVAGLFGAVFVVRPV